MNKKKSDARLHKTGTLTTFARVPERVRGRVRGRVKAKI